MTIYNVYSNDNGTGCYLQVGTYSDLASASAAMPVGGHVEQVETFGDLVVDGGPLTD